MSLESKEAPETSQPTVYSRLTLLSHLPLVLQSIKEHHTQTTIAKELGISKQAVSKLIKRLIEHEYIRLDLRSSSNIYEILPRSQLILSGGRSLFLSGIGRLHNLRFKYPFLSGGIPQDRWKRVEMVNWSKQVGDVFGVKIEVSEKSVVVSPGVFFGYNMADLLPRARGVADSVAEWLRSWYQLELGEPESVGKPEWAVVSPLPALALSNVNLKTLDSWLDASMGVVEVEFTDMVRAQKFIDIPKALDEIKGNLRNHRSITEPAKTEVNHKSTTSQPEVNHVSTKAEDTGQTSTAAQPLNLSETTEKPLESALDGHTVIIPPSVDPSTATDPNPPSIVRERDKP